MHRLYAAYLTRRTRAETRRMMRAARRTTQHDTLSNAVHTRVKPHGTLRRRRGNHVGEQQS